MKDYLKYSISVLNCLQTISGYELCIFFKDFTLVSQTKKNITNVQINVENVA